MTLVLNVICNLAMMAISSRAIIVDDTGTGGRNYKKKHRFKSNVSWINGIAHTPEDAKETAEEMSRMFSGSCINYCHNPTSVRAPTDAMGYVRDLTQCTRQKVGGKVTGEVIKLREHLRRLIKQTGRHGKVVHLAHSQGALITYLAAKNLTKAEQEKMEVVCFGGAAAITTDEFPHFSRCVNYYSVNDPLLHVVGSAEKALT